MVLINRVPVQMLITILLQTHYGLLPLKSLVVVGSHDLLQYELVNECIPVHAILGGVKR